MPEMPEVEVVRRGLAPYVSGRTIDRVEVHDVRSIRQHTPGADHLGDALVGRRIRSAVRRGKFLWLLDDHLDDALMVHLGMSGQLRVSAPPATDPAPAGGPGAGPTGAAPSEGPASDPVKHLRVRLELDDGTRIDFIDQRIFGGLWLSPLEETADAAPAGEGDDLPLIPSSAAHIARDLTDPQLDVERTVAAIRRSRASIKSLLLNQQVVSGIGNIYADEALWAARIHYERPGESVSAAKVRQLLAEARAVMERALEVGGTSFDALYVNVDGRSGYFARDLNVYGRSGLPCRRCGTPIVREKFTNRSSHFCPSCQRKR
ncbi:bifunctional DNA-formamidopyrimidine glycosylase/DNA-(apurinic or apyrimidinic site) lyase [Helcobacillus sp. ACRRO]|uniref:bifunctional DNA-formamidopyrimidine glycosylase/DNA-(apurinic or apyrimidinic site) lyase n=1 Tax=Helcobacillus sp. ACRRO TaxID=2918202 RepID=UPI001EF67DF7|nr:bifunctional DNA-formamidopyrimidine glycosylase/DNA-(apurinic or apyrimidinic site) lyase [Helcobacillus sp. ACRRO]MCG7426753.1 bifunctional DNA-formamidopyrimidine glycosylase/DNA-(apurinic or apyrimidinic site) lyase [Helcobacillus sp. ACRRO]